jgi:hypothetical protein
MIPIVLRLSWNCQGCCRQRYCSKYQEFPHLAFTP